VETVQAQKCRLVSVTESFDSGSPAGRMMVGMLAICAEFEREQIIERVKEAVRQTAMRGDWHGRSPVGYMLKDKKLLPDPDQAPFVKLVFEQIASGMVLREVCRNFSAAVRGPAYGAWTTPWLHKIVNNPVYIGKVRSNGEVYEGKHDPLISEQLWLAAQTAIEARRIKHKIGKKDYLLSGILRCRVCGDIMTGKTSTYQRKGENRPQTNSDYVCNRYQAAHLCTGSFISVRKAERALIACLKALSRGPAIKLQSLPVDDVQDEARAILQRELNQIPRRRARQIELAERGLINESELDASRLRLEKEEKQLLESLTSLKPAQKKITKSVFRDAVTLLEDESAPFPVRRGLLKSLFARIDWEQNGEIILTLRG
jgi:site-specific DNA recombinase